MNLKQLTTASFAALAVTSAMATGGQNAVEKSLPAPPTPVNQNTNNSSAHATASAQAQGGTGSATTTAGYLHPAEDPDYKYDFTVTPRGNVIERDAYGEVHYAGSCSLTMEALKVKVDDANTRLKDFGRVFDYKFDSPQIKASFEKALYRYLDASDSLVNQCAVTGAKGTEPTSKSIGAMRAEAKKFH